MHHWVIGLPQRRFPACHKVGKPCFFGAICGTRADYYAPIPLEETTTSAVSNANGSTAASQASANATGRANNSTLALAVNQALAQLSGGANLSSLLTPASQQSSSDFVSSLLASLQGSSSSNSS